MELHLDMMVCSNADLHESDDYCFVFENRKYFVIKLEFGGLTWYNPTPDFVVELITNAEEQVYVDMRYGVCASCFEIIEATEELIREVGGET